MTGSISHRILGGNLVITRPLVYIHLHTRNIISLWGAVGRKYVYIPKRAPIDLIRGASTNKKKMPLLLLYTHIFPSSLVKQNFGWSCKWSTLEHLPYLSTVDSGADVVCTYYLGKCAFRFGFFKNFLSLPRCDAAVCWFHSICLKYSRFIYKHNMPPLYSSMLWDLSGPSSRIWQRR